jgi:sugar phosphate isomerase/epimerase
MRLGIFAKTFPGTIGENFEAIAKAGIHAVQYNLSIAGLPTVPEQPVDEATLSDIREAAARSSVDIPAISGTFNAAHPDPQVRRRGVAGFRYLAAAAHRLDIPVVTLSSGSRNRENMWSPHPENSSDQAWSDSRETLLQLAGIAEEVGVDIAFEPEHTNVASTADLGRRMLDEIDSARVKVVFDAANLIDTGDLSSQTMRATIDHALDVLGPDIALAHAKELVADRSQIAPGDGVLPWDHIIAGLRRRGFTGTVVTHGLPVSGVARAVSTLDPLMEA